MNQTEAVSTAERAPRWPVPRDEESWLRQTLKDPVLLVALAGVALAFVAYIAGLRALFVPLLILLNAAALPMPRLLRSVVGRVVMGLLYTTALLQIAAVVQFFVARTSGFIVAAGITAFGNAVFLVLTPARCRALQRIAVVTVSDVGALLAALVFLVPFAAFVAGHQVPVRIAEISSSQNVDAMNQFMLIGDQLRNQHLTYGMHGVLGGFGDVAGYSVPLGFYTMLAFVENTFFTTHAALGWQGAAALYFTEYMVAGALVAFGAVKLCHTWIELLRETNTSQLIERLVPVLAGIAVAIPLVLFYEFNLVWLGFLAYLYVLLVSIATILCLVEFRSTEEAEESPGRRQLLDRAIYLVGALVLLYGVSATWPLLLPALLVTLLVSLSRSGSSVPRAEWLRAFVSPSGLLIASGLALQLIPVYFQFHYGGGLAGQLNIAGDIGQFRYFVLLAAAALVVLVVSMRWVPLWPRRLTIDVLVPLLILVSAVTAEQLFTIGSATYYAVKLAMLPDILTIALGTAVLFVWLVRSRLAEPLQLLLVTALPAVVMLGLVGTAPSVLKDARLLFPGHANVDVGPNFSPDAQHYAELGLAGKLGHYNAISLHWDTTQQVFTASMELPYWANALTYDASAYDRQASQCFDVAYSSWLAGRVDAAEQSLLLSQIKRCARLADDHGQTYYVVTDPSSVPYVSTVTTGIAQLVY